MKYLLWVFAGCCLSVPLVWAAAPTIDAGPNKTIAFPAKNLTLFGHATDPQNYPLTVHWSMTSGPAAVTFSNADALATTVTFTTTGTYTFQLAVSDGISTVTSSITVTVNPASSQTAFYVDPTYTGSTQNGSALAPWKSLFDGDANQSARWATINSALASNDVIVYFSARTAGSDVSEEVTATLRVMRTDTSTHRLTLDGMSKYNTNDAAPNWVDYTGSQKFRIRGVGAGLALGEDNHNKFNYTTIRGFEVTGNQARIIIGGSYLTMEYVWSHDVTNLGAQFLVDAAVTAYPQCQDIGRNREITIRNNTIERGTGEAMYIAGTYLLSSNGGCPSYGNTHSDILIEGNTIRDAGLNALLDEQGDGIDLKAGLQNVTIRNNMIDTTHTFPGDDGGSGIVNEGTFNSAPTNYLIEGNRIYRTWGRGMFLSNLHGAIIRNNVVALAGRGLLAPNGIDFSGDRSQGFTSDNVAIYNNTIYGSAGYGMMLGVISGPVTVQNNLVVGNSGGGGDYWDMTGTISSDYNFWAPTRPTFTEGTHSIIQSSTIGILANPTSNDFHLISASPAVNKGVDLSILGNLALGTQSFQRDLDNIIRPQGTAWDMGAYEFTSGGVTALSPPTNLHFVP